jgi:hypothetical protein
MTQTPVSYQGSRLTRRQRITFLLALILVASHFSLAYISEAAPFLSLRAFAAGVAPQPFQERALTAWMLRSANRFDSPQFEAALHRLLPAMGEAFNETTLVLLIIAWISMAASIVITRETLLKLTGDALFSSWAAFLVPYMAYFTYILNFGPHFLLPYDQPSLFFFCAGLYLLVIQRPLLLVPLIAVATLNRETSLFLIGFYLVFEVSRRGEQKSRAVMLAYAAGMLAVWISMRLVVLHLYGHNPVAAASRLADLKLWQNLSFIVKPQHWPAFASVFGFTLPIVVVYRRYLEPDFLRRGLIVVAMWFGLMLFVGVLIEIRIFGELISYMSVALGVIVHRFLTTRSDARVCA